MSTIRGQSQGVCVDEFVNGWIWVQVGGPLHVPYCPCPVFLLKTVLLAEPVGDVIADVRWRCAAVLCLMRQGNVQTG